MVAADVAERIRAIFLHHEHRVTPNAAAKLLGWTRAEMNDAIDAEEINVVDTCGGKTMIELRELANYASYEWPIHVIEKALAREAALILPPGMRTRKLTVRLPLLYIQLLEVLASEAKQSVTKFLELEIEERAGNEKERLAGIIPGILEAYYWPHEVPNQRVFLAHRSGGHVANALSSRRRSPPTSCTRASSSSPRTRVEAHHEARGRRAQAAAVALAPRPHDDHALRSEHLNDGRDSRAVPAHVWPLARRAWLQDRRAGLRHRGAGGG